MEYSIRELADLSGVTTRTLRWYDQIGLLKPCRIAESGYRCYGPAEVNRLQDILYFRALGVELARIKECLDDPSFDRPAALKSHLAALEEERNRLDELIRSVRETLEAEERNEAMHDEKKFEAFKRKAVEENEAKYGKEVRRRYGDQEADRANAAVMGMSREQYENQTTLDEEIRRRLEAAVNAGQNPSDDEGREIVRLHKRWLVGTGMPYEVNRHKGIAELYVADERFTAYYDRTVSGCARFLRDAVQIWAEALEE
jgi:DNA-binding transcriptional MerR regulator